MCMISGKPLETLKNGKNFWSLLLDGGASPDFSKKKKKKKEKKKKRKRKKKKKQEKRRKWKKKRKKKKEEKKREKCRFTHTNKKFDKGVFGAVEPLKKEVIVDTIAPAPEPLLIHIHNNNFNTEINKSPIYSNHQTPQSNSQTPQTSSSQGSSPLIITTLSNANEIKKTNGVPSPPSPVSIITPTEKPKLSLKIDLSNVVTSIASDTNIFSGNFILFYFIIYIYLYLYLLYIFIFIFIIFRFKRWGLRSRKKAKEEGLCQFRLQLEATK